MVDILDKCNDCGIELTDENWYPSAKRKHYYICKKCLTKKVKEHSYAWRKAHPKEWKEIKRRSNQKHKDTKRNWARKHCLGQSNGKTLYGLNKRDYPKNNACELCHILGRRLNYHHWDDPNIGIWTCVDCHKLAEWVDKPNFFEIVEKYLALKKRVEQECRGIQNEMPTL